MQNNTVYTIQTITLQNGKDYDFKPLNIKEQRKFLVILEGLDGTDSQASALDQLLDLVKPCIASVDRELAEDSDQLEEALDEPTIYKVIEICTGVKLNDPNLLAAAMNLQVNQEDGTI